MLQGPASGPVGSISQARGDVFKTGVSGIDGVGEGADINVGDVISTGAASSATVALGGGCNLALGPSSQISVTPVDGKLCVRMHEEPVGGGLVGDAGGVVLAGAGALAVGGGLLIGLGHSEPASR